jgi:rhodanese-related sulfurtransferase
MRHQGHIPKWTVLLCFVLSVFLTKAFAAEIPKISKEDLQAMLDNPGVVIIDVRLSGNLAESSSKIKGAVREDPGKVEAWLDKYSKDKTLVFYCA